eukprot:m.99167 g.99167  ORF g.99167 m.99167 type:complete len:65 (-) comp12530_c0_seq12:74-268(-)
MGCGELYCTIHNTQKRLQTTQLMFSRFHQPTILDLSSPRRRVACSIFDNHVCCSIAKSSTQYMQ